MKNTLMILVLILFVGCTSPASREFKGKLSAVDKIHLFFRTADGKMHIARIIQADELYMLKKLLLKSRGSKSVVKFYINIRMEFFSGDSVIGQISLNAGEQPLAKYTGKESGILNMNPKLGKLLQSWNEAFRSDLALIEACNDPISKRITNEYGWLNFDSITLCQYLKLLKLEEIPNQINILFYTLPSISFITFSISGCL